MIKRLKKGKYRIYVSYFIVFILFTICFLSIADIYIVPEKYLFLFLLLGMMVLWQNFKSVLVLILSAILISYVSIYGVVLTFLGGLFLYKEVKSINKRISKIFYRKYPKEYEIINSTLLFPYSKHLGLILYGDFYEISVTYRSEKFKFLIDFKDRNVLKEGANPYKPTKEGAQQ